MQVMQQPLFGWLVLALLATSAAYLFWRLLRGTGQQLWERFRPKAPEPPQVVVVGPPCVVDGAGASYWKLKGEPDENAIIAKFTRSREGCTYTIVEPTKMPALTYRYFKDREKLREGERKESHSYATGQTFSEAEFLKLYEPALVGRKVHVVDSPARPGRTIVTAVRLPTDESV